MHVAGAESWFNLSRGSKNPHQGIQPNHEKDSPPSNCMTLYDLVPGVEVSAVITPEAVVVELRAIFALGAPCIAP